jgi:hypothetical protein
MTREKAEKASELIHQIENLEYFLTKDENKLMYSLNENNINYGQLYINPSQVLTIPNELLKDYIRQYLDYSKKEIAKLKDQLNAL